MAHRQALLVPGCVADPEFILLSSSTSEASFTWILQPGKQSGCQEPHRALYIPLYRDGGGGGSHALSPPSPSLIHLPTCLLTPRAPCLPPGHWVLSTLHPSILRGPEDNWEGSLHIGPHAEWDIRHVWFGTPVSHQTTVGIRYQPAGVGAISGLSLCILTASEPLSLHQPPFIFLPALIFCPGWYQECDCKWHVYQSAPSPQCLKATVSISPASSAHLLRIRQ